MRLRFDARRALSVLFAAVLAVSLAVTPARAEKPAEGGHATPAAAAAGEGHGEKKGGLGFLGLERYDLGIFTLIVFGLLCLILYRYAWPNIAAGLDKREAMLHSARDEAVRAKQEAEEMRQKLQAEFAQAHDKIRAMLEEARRDADELRAREREAGAKEAAAERDRARREIDAARDVALQEIYRQSVQLAALMSSKAIRRNMSADDHSRLVEESLAELKAAPARY